MRLYWSLFHSMWIALLSAFFVHAHAVTLSEVFLAAKTVDETYLGAIANFEANQESLPQALAPLLPSLSLTAQNMTNRLEKDDGVVKFPQQNYISSGRTLALRQPIIRPSAWIQLKQSSAQVISAQYELIRAENDLAIRTVSAYLDALLADTQLKALGAQIEALQAQLIATTLSVKQGQATRTDIMDVQGRLDQSRADELQVISAKKYALDQLTFFSSYAKAPPLSISFDDEINGFHKIPLQEWLNRAMENNADILTSKFRVEIVKQEILKSYSGHLPTLDFIAQISSSNNENIQFPATVFSNRQVGLQMNLPLFSGGSVLSASRQALQQTNKEVRLFNATTNNIRLQVSKEHSNFIDGISRVRANSTALMAANEFLISVEKNNQAGYKTQVDVLNAKQRVLATEKELALSKFQSLLAFLKLNLLSGESAQQSLSMVEQYIQK